MSKKLKIVILFVVVIAVGWGIGKYTTPSPSASEDNGTQINVQDNLQGKPEEDPAPAPSAVVDVDSTQPENSDDGEISEPVIADPSDSGTNDSGSETDKGFTEPDSIAVMVNKEYGLPDNYKPSDLVYPDVRFTFTEKIEKRMMRSEAAKALEKMFAGAEEDGIYLAGVSAYRSLATQTTLFNRYVKKDGEEKAKTYSAVPGYSEHQTGLSIDVSGSDGKCAADSCFGGTKEANWLSEHAAEYGYIIRYPEGKQAITGYKYEPWHVRYVGQEIATYISEQGITLEEYYEVVPVSK